MKWAIIDIETTGLTPGTDTIMEVAAIVTDPLLNPITRYEVVIHHTEQQLSCMSDWSKDHHSRPRGLTGRGPSLVDLVRASTVNMRRAETSLLRLFQFAGQGSRVMLGGSSVHIDREFLMTSFPRLRAVTHFRTVDVSGMLEMYKRFFPAARHLWPPPSLSHAAMDDVTASLRLMQWFMTQQSLFGKHLAFELLHKDTMQDDTKGDKEAAPDFF